MNEVVVSVPTNTAEERVIVKERTQESELEAGTKSDKPTDEIVPGSSKSHPELPKKNFKKTYPLSPKGKCFTANSKRDFSKLMVDLHKRICKVHCTRLETSSRGSEPSSEECSPLGELVGNLIDLSVVPDSQIKVDANRNKENCSQNNSLKISKPNNQMEIQVDSRSQQPGTYDSHLLQSCQAATEKRNSTRREYQASVDYQEQVGEESQECGRQVRTEGAKKISEHKENRRLESEDQVLRSEQQFSDNLCGINMADNVTGTYTEFSDVTRNPELFTSTQFNECETASCQSEVVPSSYIHEEEEEDLQIARRSQSYRHFNSLVCEINSSPSVSDANDSLQSADTRASESTEFTGVMEVDSVKEIDISVEKNCSKTNSSLDEIKRIENIKKNIQMKSSNSSVLGRKLQKTSNCIQDDDVRKTKALLRKSKQALSSDLMNNHEERFICSDVLYQHGKCSDNTQDSSMDVLCEEREDDADNREGCSMEVISFEEQHGDEENVDRFVGIVSHSRSETESYTCFCNRPCADEGIQFASGRCETFSLQNII